MRAIPGGRSGCFFRLERSVGQKSNDIDSVVGDARWLRGEIAWCSPLVS